MIFDSNVLIALIEGKGGPDYTRRIARLQADYDVRINEIIFAEVSVHYASAANLNEVLGAAGIECTHLTLEECHRAGLAFAEYRRRGGERPAILPDFLIGAQAEIRGWPLVTRDRRGFASYFPQLEIIDPMGKTEDCND
ncbi:MAG: type II toxin-antitoxin system VapC family toxin [Sphingomonadaceae bacterium]|nr:type II toxin-antitoxin system VapC family toxin [Sphingomonadaceae bacterium]